jgi:hypothetical protein
MVYEPKLAWSREIKDDQDERTQPATGHEREQLRRSA